MKERPLKQVGKFSYLGSKVNRIGQIHNEINEMIKKPSRFCQLVMDY